MKDLLNQVGLEAERVRMFNMSSAMASQFVDAAQEMTAQVAALGRNPIGRMKDEGGRMKEEQE